jgi:hypothetical protein
MGVDDFIDILRCRRAIPDAVRIDHHERPGVAKSETSGGGEADIGEPLRLEGFCEPVP